MRRDAVLPYVSVVTDAAVDVFDAESELLLLTVTADLSGRSLLPLPLRLRLAIGRAPFSAPTACWYSQDARPGRFQRS
jgi:hypothetical protein